MAPAANRRKGSRMSSNRGRRELSVAALVNRALQKRLETKVFAQGAIGAATTTAGTVVQLTTGISQGDSNSTRTGDQIMIHHLKFYFRFTAVTTSQSVRVVLFRDRLNQSALPAVADLLINGVWISPYTTTKQIQEKRFTILLDETLDCNINGETVKSMTVERSNIGRCSYTGNAGTASDAGPGALFFIIIGSASTGLYDYESTIRFTDA
nr:structural protein [Riboviria sp.]